MVGGFIGCVRVAAAMRRANPETIIRYGDSFRPASQFRTRRAVARLSEPKRVVLHRLLQAGFSMDELAGVDLSTIRDDFLNALLDLNLKRDDEVAQKKAIATLVAHNDMTGMYQELAAPRLRAVLQGPKWQFRVCLAAVDALEHFPSPATVQRLRDVILNHWDPHTRNAAPGVLFKIRTATVCTREVAELLNDLREVASGATKVGETTEAQQEACLRASSAIAEIARLQRQISPRKK